MTALSGHSVPLAVRARMARGVAIALLLLVTAGTVTVVATGDLASRPLRSALLAVPVLAVAAVVVVGSWRDRLPPRLHEALLVGLLVVPGLEAVASYATDSSLGSEVLTVLAPLGVASAFTLTRSGHLVASTALLAAATLVAIGRGTLTEASFAIVIAATSAAVAGLGAAVLAAQIATSALREREATEASRALRAVVDAARSATSSEAQEVLDAVVRATTILDSDMAGVYLLGDDGALRFASWQGLRDDLVSDQLDPTEGIVGEALREDRIAVAHDYRIHDGARGRWVEAGLRSAMAVPIHVDDGTVGVLAAGRFRPGGYDDAATMALELLADHASRALTLAAAIDEDRQLLVRLRALDELQQDFVATVGHELRTPLTVVDGLATTLEHHFGQLDEATARELLGRLRANTTALSTIVTSLLDAARLDRGLVELDAQPVDVDDLLRSCVDRLSPALEGLHVEIGSGRVPPVLADAGLIERVVDNVLTNAHRHTPTGTTVSIDVHDLGDRVVVSIRDDGPGIRAADLRRITQRFTRGGDLHTRDGRGLGLGLALADQILRLHGSRLLVSSPPGRGAEFRFSLRTAPTPHGDGDRRVEPSPRTAPGRSGRPTATDVLLDAGGTTA